ncbi:hypothetical protein Tco_1219588 [Tanacetum coccineum]
MAYHDKYKKILDEIWNDKVELDGKIVKEDEEAVKRIKGEALKEKDDPRAFIFPIRLEGHVNKNALADTVSDINTMPYRIYEQLGREDVKKVDRGITMINHTQAEAMGILTNVLCQVGVTTLIAKFLILDIPIDRDAPIVTMGTHDDEAGSSRSKRSRQNETVEEIPNGHANVAWLIAMWMKRKGAGTQKESQICCGQFISKIARKYRVLTEDVVRSLSAPIYCRDLDTTPLRDLIDFKGKLIPEDPSQEYLELVFLDLREQLCRTCMIGWGAYNPPGYAQPQYDKYYQQYPPPPQYPPQYQQ